MKFTPDRKMLEGIRALPDEKLWHLARKLAAALPTDRKSPDLRRLTGIRAVLDHITDEDLIRLNALIDIYNRSKEGGRRI